MGTLLLMTLLAVAVLSYAGAFGERWSTRLRRALRPAWIAGGIGFAGGFFGPMILAPDANQGPLLGILITGPLGFIGGLLYGIGREWLSRDPA